MDTITTLNAIKSVFSGLGAKTSDSSYAVPLVNSSTAEPQGYMSMANLASVLGAIQRLALLTNGYDIDEIDYTSSCIVGSGNTSPHKPSGQTNGSLLTVVTGGGRRVQLWVSENTVFVRQYDQNYSGGWYDWQRTDNFGYNSLSDLASAMGGWAKGFISATDDCNNYKTYGSYLCNGDAANLPSAATYLLYVIEAQNSDSIIQIAVNRDNEVQYRRVFYGDQGWSSWSLVYDHNLLTNTTELSSLASALGVYREQVPEEGLTLSGVQFGYGLLIITNITDGITQLYSLNAFSADSVAGNSGATVEKTSEYSIRISRQTGKTTFICFISLKLN